jgi:hypothetical protein
LFINYELTVRNARVTAGLAGDVSLNLIILVDELEILDLARLLFVVPIARKNPKKLQFFYFIPLKKCLKFECLMLFFKIWFFEYNSRTVCPFEKWAALCATDT